MEARHGRQPRSDDDDAQPAHRDHEQSSPNRDRPDGTASRYFWLLIRRYTNHAQAHRTRNEQRFAGVAAVLKDQFSEEKVKKEVDASGKWNSPLVTEIVEVGAFYRAEDYHQDYLEKNPNGYTCHWIRD